MSEARKGREMPKGKDSKKAVAVDQFDLEGNFIKTSAGFVWKYH
jgi:hypothetical protein